MMVWRPAPQPARRAMSPELEVRRESSWPFPSLVSPPRFAWNESPTSLCRWYEPRDRFLSGSGTRTSDKLRTKRSSRIWSMPETLNRRVNHQNRLRFEIHEVCAAPETTESFPQGVSKVCGRLHALSRRIVDECVVTRF